MWYFVIKINNPYHYWNLNYPVRFLIYHCILFCLPSYTKAYSHIYQICFCFCFCSVSHHGREGNESLRKLVSRGKDLEMAVILYWLQALSWSSCLPHCNHFIALYKVRIWTTCYLNTSYIKMYLKINHFEITSQSPITKVLLLLFHNS